jgi:hypothetical protein
MALSIGHRENDIGIVDALIEVRPPFHPAHAISELAGALKRFNNISRVTGDRYALGWVEAELARYNITLEYDTRVRTDIYRECAPMLRSGRARLLDIERATTQFLNLEVRALPGGSVGQN